MYKFLILIYLTFLPLSIIAQEDWKLKKDANDISIYTRMVPNESIDEYKAETTLNVPIEKVLEELLTAPAYYASCEPNISYYVKKLSENEHIFYAYESLPWPIKDRDVITLLTVEKISDTKIKLVLKALPNFLPEKEKVIRVKELKGYWLLEENDDKTKVTQQLFVNPEGALPTIVVNRLLIKGPYKTFSNLRAVFSETDTAVSKKK